MRLDHNITTHKNGVYKERKSKIIEFGVNYEFPITLRIKPTNHEQMCYKCTKPIEKGSMQMRIRDGSWHRQIGKREGDDSYISCCTRYNTAVTGIVYSSTPSFRAPRFLYLHTDCFYCLMTKLAMEAKAPVTNCNKCPERFSCFTEVFSTEGVSSEHYVPSTKPKRFTKTNYRVRHDKYGAILQRIIKKDGTSEKAHN